MGATTVCDLGRQATMRGDLTAGVVLAATGGGATAGVVVGVVGVGVASSSGRRAVNGVLLGFHQSTTRLR